MLVSPVGKLRPQEGGLTCPTSLVSKGQLQKKCRRPHRRPRNSPSQVCQLYFPGPGKGHSAGNGSGDKVERGLGGPSWFRLGGRARREEPSMPGIVLLCGNCQPSPASGPLGATCGRLDCTGVHSRAQYGAWHVGGAQSALVESVNE